MLPSKGFFSRQNGLNPPNLILIHQKSCPWHLLVLTQHHRSQVTHRHLCGSLASTIFGECHCCILLSTDRLIGSELERNLLTVLTPPLHNEGSIAIYIYIYCTREINSPCWNYFKVLYLKYISGQRVTTDLFQKIFEESSRSITSHWRPELGRVDHRDSPNFTANKGPRELFQRNFTPKKISPSYTWRPAHDFVANAPNSCMDGSQVIGLMLCKISWSWDSCQWCFQKSQHLPHRPHLQSNSFPRIKQHEAASAWRF